jgi:hypothetical protein
VRSLVIDRIFDGRGNRRAEWVGRPSTFPPTAHYLVLLPKTEQIVIGVSRGKPFLFLEDSDVRSKLEMRLLWRRLAHRLLRR